MGRVARYKKIKSFDPYSKQNRGRIDLETVGVWGLGESGRKPKKRSRTAEKLRAQRKRPKTVDDGFDAPPEDEDDFDMNDLVGSVKKQEPTEAESETIVTSAAIAVKSTSPVAPSEEEERKLNRLLQLDQQVVEKEPEMQGRMEGESKRAFHKRVARETRSIIKRERMEAHNPEKRQRKKEFLKNKKKKKKGQLSTASRASSAAGRDDDDDELITGERAVATVRFGEQAERPPVFSQLPRGATKKQSSNASKSRSMSDSEIAAEQEAMDLLRRKAQAQYALIKQKRKAAGDFHL